MNANHTRRAASLTITATFALLVTACGDGSGSGPASTQSGTNGGPAQTASAGNSAQGPDLSQLAQIVLGKINQDPTRVELKITGKLADFNVVSAKTEVHEGMGASSVVECAGVVVFDGDVEWSWQDTELKKAGVPAKFECQAEYLNQGQGWQIFGPMGIYPISG